MPKTNQAVTDGLRAKLKRGHPHITLLSAYSGDIKALASYYCAKHSLKFKNKFSTIKYSSGCPICKRENYELASAARTLARKASGDTFGRLTSKEFLIRLKMRHGDRVIPLEDCGTPLKSQFRFKCKVCENVWKTSRANILASVVGCPSCGRKAAGEAVRLTNKVYSERTTKASNGRIKLVGDVSGWGSSVEHECLECGNRFFRVAIKRKVLSCPKCTPSFKGNYSLIAVNWLKRISRKQSRKILHAKNGGEQRLPVGGKYVQVDGYCPKTNTVYEFLGDCWHGNPYVYSPEDRCHPHNKKVTAKSLYKNTLSRFLSLTKAGYSVIYVWQSQYRKGKGRLVSGVMRA